jgi:hypothetical protein
MIKRNDLSLKRHILAYHELTFPAQELINPRVVRMRGRMKA